MDRAIDRPLGTRQWMLLVALSVLWGGSFFFAKVAVAELPPLTVVWLRVSAATVALLAFLRLTAVAMPTSAASWCRFAVMGLLNNVVPFGLMFWAQTRISTGLAAILNATTPLFGLVLSRFLARDERLTPGRIAGVLCGFCGVVVMIGLDALRADTEVLAQFAVLAGACSYGLAGIYGRRFRDAPPMTTAAGQLAASTLILLPLIAIADQPWMLPMPSAHTIAALAGLALLSTALGYVLYFRILAESGANNLLLVTLLIPLSALLLGTIVLGERLVAAQIGGMVLIIAGLAAIDGRLFTIASAGGRR